MRIYTLIVTDESGLPYPKRGDIFVVKDVRRAHEKHDASYRVGVEVDLERILEHPIAVAGWSEPEGIRQDG
jgi:hypothetical protein